MLRTSSSLSLLGSIQNSLKAGIVDVIASFENGLALTGSSSRWIIHKLQPLSNTFSAST